MNRKNIKIIRNKKVFCKVINTKKKHKILVYKPNSRIFFKFKFNKAITTNNISLEDLERILICLNELDFIYTKNKEVSNKCELQ